MPALPVLSVSRLSRSFGTESVFDNLSFHLTEREHAGLVGINGSGKSTLLRIIAGLEEPNSGEITRSSGLRVTYLPQEAKYTSDRTILEEARLAFAPVLEASDRMREVEQLLGTTSGSEQERLLDEYAVLQHRFEVHGGFDIEHRSHEVLAGLGFRGNDLNQPVRQLSGGQRTRVALAKALLADPDLLLLDEPTNHLDLGMLEWLEAFLSSWGGAYLVVSHDRYFLDRVTTRTLDLSFGTIADYPAPYSGYVNQRKERLDRQKKEYEEQQAYIARTEEFIRKYKAGQRAREARGRQTKLDRLPRIPAPRTHRELDVSFTPVVRSGDNVLMTSEVSAGYSADSNHLEDRPVSLVVTPELTIRRGDRVGLIGPNGGGKTTLLRTLVGDLEPLSGTVEFGTNVQVGYYAQAHEQLPSKGTPISVVMGIQPMGEESARSYLGRFLFSNDDVFKPVSALSGGERSRLAIAMLLLQRANFLVLDEPTNHLDISSREALEEMLREFDGTILFVSHDRFFVDRIADHIWEVEGGTLSTSLGGYTNHLRQKGRSLPEADSSNQGKTKHPGISCEQTPEVAAAVNGSQSGARGEGQLRKTLTRVERSIGKFESRLNAISDALTIAEVDEDYEMMANLSAEHSDVQTKLDEAYLEWDEVSDELNALDRQPIGATS